MTHHLLLTQNKHFSETLHTTLENARKRQQSGALLLISIDNFSMVLANYGNKQTEELFLQLTDSLNTQIKGHGSAFYIDSAIIAIILDKPVDAIPVWGEKLHYAIQHFSCVTASIPVYLAASIGYELFPDSINDAQQLIEHSYIALNTAQNDPASYCYCFADTEKKRLHSKHQMILANYMQNAVLDKRVRLAFQPVIHSQTGHVMYHECLLRVIDDNGKITSAGPFIPVAESLGFIDIIDDIVLEMVMEELHNSPDIMLAFNISNLTVGNEKWLEKAKSLLKDSNIASRTIVEMTETAIQGELKKVSSFMATLQGLGCQVAIDDFGAGYTSFRQLKSLPVDIVKIDGYFVKDIVDNSDNRLFVKTLLDMTNGLGLKAVAEFVETGEIAKLLMELKVDYMQGNYFCPAVNYRSWIKEERYA